MDAIAAKTNCYAAEFIDTHKDELRWWSHNLNWKEFYAPFRHTHVYGKTSNVYNHQKANL
jgi:hypothetical protein